MPWLISLIPGFSQRSESHFRHGIAPAQALRLFPETESGSEKDLRWVTCFRIEMLLIGRDYSLKTIPFRFENEFLQETDPLHGVSFRPGISRFRGIAPLPALRPFLKVSTSPENHRTRISPPPVT